MFSTKSTLVSSFLFALLSLPTGCGGSSESDSTGSISSEARRGDDRARTPSVPSAPSAGCASDADCPMGQECEVEVEHGVTTSSCKAHSGTVREDDAGAAPPGTPTSGNCASDADCPAGQECEVEVEHGVTTSSCKAHRRRGGR